MVSKGIVDLGIGCKKPTLAPEDDLLYVKAVDTRAYICFQFCHAPKPVVSFNKIKNLLETKTVRIIMV